MFDTLSDTDILLHRIGVEVEMRRRPVHVCAKCSGEILEGEKYMNLDGEILCPECVDEMRAIDVLDMFGYFFRRASI